MNSRFNVFSSAIVTQNMLLLPYTLSECESLIKSSDIADLVTAYRDNIPAYVGLDLELDKMDKINCVVA